ncbi:MAG: hypothetical protein ACFFCS_03610 [Candidatus Hodarchaeota archaeon]
MFLPLLSDLWTIASSVSLFSFFRLFVPGLNFTIIGASIECIMVLVATILGLVGSRK